MRNRWLSIVLFIFLLGCKNEADISPSSSESYVKLFAGQYSGNGEVIKSLPDNGFIILANSTDNVAEFNYAQLIRLDEFGNTLWNKTYNVEEDQLIGNSIAVIGNDEGYIVIGDRINSSKSDSVSMYLFKVDQNGENFLGVDIDATELTDGNTVFNGETHGIDVYINSQNTVITLAYMDATNTSKNATITAERSLANLSIGCVRYDEQQNEVLPVKSLFYDPIDNATYLGGYVQNEGSNFSNVMRIPSNCNLSSDSTFPDPSVGAGEDYIASQIIPFGVGFAIVGTTNKNGANTDIYFSITDNLGDEIRTKVFDEIFDDIDFAGIDEGFGIAKTTDGGLIITGSTRVTGGAKLANEEDAILIKCDAFGNINWIKKFGDTNQENGVYVQQTADGGYALLANIEYGGVDMMALIKTDKNGDLD